MENLVPEEIIAYIFKNMESDELSFKSITIQRKIYSLRRNNRFYPLLKQFRFSGSPAAPFSDVLDSALFNLQYGEKLSRLNPDLVHYKLTEKFFKYYDEVEQKVEEKDANILKEIARNIKTSLAI